MSKSKQMQMGREFAQQEANARRREWDKLYAEKKDIDYCSKCMGVSASDAFDFMTQARERAIATEEANAREREADTERKALASRRKPSLNEALLIWGTDGIMRVKSRIKYERQIRIPQSMA